MNGCILAFRSPPLVMDCFGSKSRQRSLVRWHSRLSITRPSTSEYLQWSNTMLRSASELRNSPEARAPAKVNEATHAIAVMRYGAANSRTAPSWHYPISYPDASSKSAANHSELSLATAGPFWWDGISCDSYARPCNPRTLTILTSFRSRARCGSR
jgi:hypothetical protein